MLLVGFRSGTGEARRSKAEAHHGSAVDERIPSINVDRVRLTPGKDVLAAAREFKKERDVVFAEPNYRAHADLAPPNDPLLTQQWGPQKIQALQAHGVVYPGTYPTTSAGDPITKVRMEEQEAGFDVATGTSPCGTFTPCGKFELQGHDVDAENGTYVITSIQHSASETPLELTSLQQTLVGP